MDLPETYHSIARRYFPNAKIVSYRFHVIRLVNQRFLKACQQHGAEGRKSRGLLSLMRRHEWRLSNDQRTNLMQYRSEYPVLKAMYHAKQRSNRLLLHRTMTQKAARRQLPKLLKLLEQLKASPLHGLA
jgi:transposase